MSDSETINLGDYPIDSREFQQTCRQQLDQEGLLVLPNFLNQAAVDAVRAEGIDNLHRAFFSEQQHNVYLSPTDDSFDAQHARNRLVTSSKGCITDDQIPEHSALRKLYDSPSFRSFLCEVLNEKALFDYADPLSSINLHYAKKGQELGWHFDNSSFAITLMIQATECGGQFEYVSGMRDADVGEMNYAGVNDVLDGKIEPKTLSMHAGALVLFRGRNAIHRVAPNEGDVTRMLAVLAYNTESGVQLSESARQTFYGRLN